MTRFLALLLLLAFVLIPRASLAQIDTTILSLDDELESLLDMRVSSASKYEQSIRDAPASVTVITAEDIVRFGYRTLSDVLASLRGFYVSNDRNYDYIGVRGFGRPTDFNNRLLVLLNGTALNESLYSRVFTGSAAAIDLRTVERIEVVRGPGSALYGGSAMFGVINIITKTDVEGVQVGGEAGSYGRKEAGAQLGYRSGSDFQFMFSGRIADVEGADLYVPEYDSPAFNNGMATDLDWNQNYQLFSQVKYRAFSLQLIANRRKKGLPTGAFGSVFNDPTNWSSDHVANLALIYDQDLGASKNLYARGFVSRALSETSYPIKNNGFQYASFDESTARWAGTELRFRWDTSPALRLVAGTEFQHHWQVEYRHVADRVTFTQFNVPYSSVAGYVQGEYEVIPRLALTMGARFDYFSTVGSALTPRIALLYTPLRTSTFKLLYGAAFRAPSILEMQLYHILINFRSNLDLKPERIRTLEAVWEQQVTKHVFGIISVYTNRMTDLIERVQIPGDSLLTHDNVQGMNANGIEAEVQTRFPSGLQGYASYTYQRARLKANDGSGGTTPISNSPLHLVKAGVVVPVVGPLYVAGALRYESPRLTVYGTETETFLLADLTLSAQRIFDHIDANLRVRNLFNTRYGYPGGIQHVQPIIEQDGRTVRFELRLNF